MRLDGCSGSDAAVTIVVVTLGGVVIVKGE